MSRRSSKTKFTNRRRIKHTPLMNILQSEENNYTFVRDSFKTWSSCNQICAAGKPISVSKDHITIFFDDNALVTSKCWDKQTLEYEKIQRKQPQNLSHAATSFGTANFRDRHNTFVSCGTKIGCSETVQVHGSTTQLLAIVVNTDMNCAVVNVCYEPSLRPYFTSEDKQRMYMNAYRTIVNKLQRKRGNTPKLPIHLHFDINKTVIPFDSYDKTTRAHGMKLFPCFTYLHDALKTQPNVKFFFRSFGKDHDKVFELLGKPAKTRLVIVTPTDENSRGPFESCDRVKFPNEYHAVELNSKHIVSTWTRTRESSVSVSYANVQRALQQYPPDFGRLMSKDCCTEFPTSRSSHGASCTPVAKYPEMDLGNNRQSSDIEQQCTQLALQCQECRGIIAFDGGLTPNDDGTYTTLCNKNCKATNTFTLITSPCDLMGICHGVSKANFNTYASIYAYNEDYIAIHDYGNLAPVHLLIIPTRVAIPDVLSLCVDPATNECGKTGTTVLQEMKALAVNIFRKMCGLDEMEKTNTVYAPNLRTMGEMYSLTEADADENSFLGDALPPKLLAFFNVPASQSQLHLQVLVLPLFRAELDKAFTKNETTKNWCHFGWPRTVPLYLAERVVAKEIVDKNKATDIVGTSDTLDKSDWYKFCRQRLEMVTHDKKYRPFVEGKRNDVLVLPQCFYHSALETNNPMQEVLGPSYRNELTEFITDRTGTAALGENTTATIARCTDTTTKDIKCSKDYLTMLSNTAYTHPRSNIVTEYFIQRLTKSS